MTDWLTKEQIDRLSALEVQNFEENMESGKARDALDERWEAGEFGDDVMEYFRKREETMVPFFNIGCCTKMIDRETVIRPDGHCTMTWRLEWDHDSIANIFAEGVKWANEHGAGIPMQ